MINKVTEIAKMAGELIMHHYSTPQIKYIKNDNSPITLADLEANKFICDSLKKINKNIPIVSEESLIPPFEVRKKWNYFWLVDPLDGTKEFVKKNDQFTVNIALVEKRVPILGVIYVPPTQTTYFGERERGSFKNQKGRLEQLFSKPPLPGSEIRALISSSHAGDSLQKLQEKFGSVQVDSVGSSLKFAYLAEGKADIYLRTAPCKDWDVAAGDAVFRYSGRNGPRSTPFRYNKKSLINNGFIIGESY